MGFAHGGRNPSDPLDRRLGDLGEVVLALEDTVGHQVGSAICGVQLLNVGMAHLAKLLGITTCYRLCERV
jgi:hypothetical protein